MAFPVASIGADLAKVNFIGPLDRSAKSLFGAKQDPRFANAGSQADIIAGQQLVQGQHLGASQKGAFQNSARFPARRPLRGIQIKEDTYCSLRIIAENGAPVFQIDAAGADDTAEGRAGLGRSFINTNFIAQTIQEERIEKSQIVETFGEPFIFFFGERPRFIHISGYLLNTVDFNWRAEWWENYETKLRGTRLVDQRAKVYLTWDDMVVVGYILNATCQDLATEPYRIPFQFSIYLTNYFNIGIRGKIPTGTVDPIKQLQEGRDTIPGPDGVFSTIFPPATQDKIRKVTKFASPIRNALSVVQGFTKQGGVGIGDILDTPQDIEALSLLRGGARPPVKFGPLRNNYDEFLNTELEALEFSSAGFSGMSARSFMQRLLNFVPGLNDAKEILKTVADMRARKISWKSVKLSGKHGKTFGKEFKSAFWDSGEGSSPFNLANK